MAENEELHALIDEVAGDAEAARGQDEGAPMPPHVKVSRPNRAARTRTLQVRLEPGEYEALERVAAERGLPVSTVARVQLLALIDEPATDPLEQLKVAARNFTLVYPTNARSDIASG